VTRGGINGAAVDAQRVADTADSATADEMAVRIVDFLQPIEIEQKQRERAPTAIGALGFIFQNIEQAAIVGEAREGMADGEVANLLEEASVVEQRATESNGVADDAESLREDEGCIH